MSTRKLFTTLFVVLMLLSAMPALATAASIEITSSIKSSLDKTIASADRTQAVKISSLYNELITLQQQEQDWDATIKALHTKNSEALTLLNKQINQIDEAQLDKLEADVTETRERYKSLFAAYTALNKQIATAKSLKNKTLSTLLQFQATTLKIPVQFARLNIKAKETAWQTAKDNKTKTVKKIRGTLDDIDPLKVQIKAKQSAINTTETGITPVWSLFKQTVKKEEAKGVVSTLTSLVSSLRQTNEEKQKVFHLESKISDILTAAKAQLPSL